MTRPADNASHESQAADEGPEAERRPVAAPASAARGASSRRRAWTRTFIVWAIALLALAFLVERLVGDLDALRAALDAPGPSFYAGLLLVLALMLYFPLIWWSLLRGVGIDMPLKQAYTVWWLSNAAKYVPGKAAYLAGRVWLGRGHGKARVLESMVWEFSVNVSSGAIAGLTLFLVPGVPAWLRPLFPLFALAALLSLVPLASPHLAQRVLRAPFRWLGRGELAEAPQMSRSRYALSLSLALGVWPLWGIAHLLLLRGIGLDAPFLAIVGGYALAWTAGYVLVFLPAGLGAREVGLAALLAPFFVSGGAALFALASRSAIIGADLIVLVLAALIAWRGRGPARPEGRFGVT